MKNKVSSLLFLLLFAGSISARAQGTLYLSNQEEASGASLGVASDQWLAALFRTGENPQGYMLTSVQLCMNPATGNPGGFAAYLYSMDESALSPGSSLGALSGADPSAGGLFSYTTTGITLSPSTAYFIVLTSASLLANDAYNWSLTGSSTFISSDNWWLSHSYQRSIDNGSTWPLSRLASFQFGVYAAPIPEPSSIALLIGTGLLLGFRKLRSRR